MDKIEAMQTFVDVVNEGSFSKAAEKRKTSPQLVSKHISQLEQKLDTRLLNRTTRRVNATEVGQAYYLRCQQVLIDIDEMERSLDALSHQPRGVLRINAPVSFATHHLAKALVDFQIQCPEVSIDLSLNDRKVDILEEGFDVALRIGELKSSSLIAKRIAPVRLVTCASPSYLDAYGTPLHPQELSDHNYLSYSYMSKGALFDAVNENNTPLPGASRFTVNNGDVLMQAAIAGHGIVVQPTFIVGPAIAEGKLRVILEDYSPRMLGLYAVYAHRQLLSSKLRSFIDFLDGYFDEPPYWDTF